MNINIIITSLFFVLFTLQLQGQNESNPMEGLWLVGDIDESQVEIIKTKEGFWQGTIVITNVPRSVGKLLFKKGVYNHEKEHIVGILIHPNSGFEVKGTLSLENPNQLKVYAQKFFLHKTLFWTKPE